MKHPLGWREFEAHVNQLLGLSGTVSSGNQAHDPGDGVDRRHPSETDYALMVDAKYTIAGSFTVNRKLMGSYIRRAATAGKRFALPVRLVDPCTSRVDDYIVVPLDDFAMLLESYREKER